MPRAGKYPAVADRRSASGSLPGPGSGRPSMNTNAMFSSPRNGRLETPPTAVTPGSARRRSNTASKNPVRRAALSYFDSGRSRSRASTPWGRNPGSTAVSRQKLRTSRPAPTTSSTARAVSATTSALRVRRPLVVPVPARVPSRSVPARSVWVAWRLGASPATTPDSTVRPRVKSSIGRFRANPAGNTRLGGSHAANARSVHQAPSSPRAPPASERARLSVRSWRAIRPRAAPRAVRMATSF